jgi:UDP-N-acetylmuramoyl-tripeptide--D-alanyl-D-alanine ligase
MLPLSVAEILEAVQGVLVLGDPRASVGLNRAPEELLETKGWPPPGISTDSRSLKRGDLFFAIRGERFDGHLFLTDAVKRGAAACVVSQLPKTFNIQAQNLAVIKVKDTKRALADCARAYRMKYGSEVPVVSICGSSGKTTVKEMTAQVLSGYAPTVFSPGNHNNDIGCPVSLFAFSPSFRFGVFEIGVSAVGEVKRLAEIVRPRVSVVTNIQLEHTATFGTIEDIAKGESEVLPLLPPGGWAVLPRDDAFFDFMSARVPSGCRVKSFGFSDQASVQAIDISTWPETRFTLRHRDESGKIIEEIECTLPVLGKFNVLNACAAAAAAFCLGVPKESIRDGVGRFSPPGLRFQISRLDSGAVLVNDSYNANPGSMKSSLSSFVECFPDRKRCVVLGDMLELGEISRKEHEDLGTFLAGLSLSRIVLFGAQSRFVLEGCRKALMDERTVVHCPDRDGLLKETRDLLSPEAAVLFKGSRGMKLDEIVSALTRPF